MIMLAVLGYVWRARFEEETAINRNLSLRSAVVG
jgi:hypothetical protein